MLDTNICIELLRARSEKVFNRLRRCGDDEVAISSITLAELEYGVAKSSNPIKHASLLLQFVAPLSVAPFEDRAAAQYGIVRATLERAGKQIGPLDTLIAAHALSLGLTVVTNNEREFRRVKGLTIENWLV